MVLTLYKCKNKIGSFYVIAESFNAAAEKVERLFVGKNYFFSDSEVSEIRIITREVDKTDKIIISESAALIL